MNQNMLDFLLREINEDEKKYLDGWYNTNYKDIPIVEINGEKVCCLTLDKLRKNSKNEYVFISKHDRFQKHPKHSHPAIEINYMYSGSCQQKINGEIHELKEGNILIMNEDTIHEIYPLKKDDILINILIATSYFGTHFLNRFGQNIIITNFIINALSKNVIHNQFMIIDGKKSYRLKYIFMELFI
jgi:quercetin dioxygenase-like cupin family protein